MRVVMLVASYLVGFDNQDTVRHLAVDNILPEQLQCPEIHLCSRGHDADEVLNIVDLALLFPNADPSCHIICLPSIPPNVVSHLLAGKSLQVMDFASGREVSLLYPVHQQRCS
jgi:hypothetical protein